MTPVTPSRPVLRPVLATASVALACLAASGCGGGDDDVPTPTVAANDPATVLCRQFPDLARQSCESAYFSCRDHTAEVRSESDVATKAGPRTVSTAYVKAYWAEWNPQVKDAARHGCRGGLDDVG